MLPRELDVVGLFPASTRDEWNSLAQADIGKGTVQSRLTARLYDGIDLQPLYTAVDFARAASDGSGFSGVPPFTRGGAPLGTALRGWDVRQEHAHPDPATINREILEDLEHGVMSILLRLDAAGRELMDADEPEAATLVGVDGCSISSADDLEIALRDVRLQMIHTSLEAGAAFVPAAAMLSAVWKRQQIADADVRGAFNADPLSVLARDGHLPMKLARAMDMLADLAVWTDATFARVTSVRVGTAAYHHAGATATQDIAFAMATGVEYMRAMTRAGLSVDRAARQILFSFAVGSEFFLAASKLRAARRLWCRVIEECGGSEEARRMTMHVRPSRRIMATRDPWVNIVRNTACVFAAGLGGADGIGSMPFDAPLGQPTQRARRLARNTQLILQDECNLHRVCDPAGGSWYIESLTDRLCSRSWEIFQEIERRGGMSASLRDGWIKSQIDAASAARTRDITTRKTAVLGVSTFANLAEQVPASEAVDLKAVAAAATARVKAHRSSRRGTSDERPAVQRPGDMSRWACHAAARGATIGDMRRLLQPQGTDFIDGPLALHTFGEAFERLRDASDAYVRQCGTRPRVFVASMGPMAKHIARTTFCRHFFEAGGFEVLTSDGHQSADAAVNAFVASDASIATIASDDDTYPQCVPELAPKLHAAGARTVVLAGHPGANETTYRAAGIDRFIFIKCDVVRTLAELLSEEGVVV